MKLTGNVAVAVSDKDIIDFLVNVECLEGQFDTYCPPSLAALCSLAAVCGFVCFFLCSLAAVCVDFYAQQPHVFTLFHIVSCRMRTQNLNYDASLLMRYR